MTGPAPRPGAPASRRGLVVAYLAAAFVVVLGVTAFVLGGADDSPGLQGLGALVAAAGVVLGVRTRRRVRGR